MADVKISGLPTSTVPLAGTEVLPIVQGGVTKQVANNDLRPKQIQSNATTGVLQVAGPTAGTTRVMTTPDANFTAARTDAAQTFSGTQTFSRIDASNATGGGLISTFSSTWSTTRIALQGSGVTGAGIINISNNAATVGFPFEVQANGVGTFSCDTAGNLRPVGNLVIGTSGKGIDFSATPGTGTSELLADYEEGTFTAVLDLQVGSITLDTSFDTLSYIKIGKQVYITGAIKVSSVSGPDGFIRMTLPFISANSAETSSFSASPMCILNTIVDANKWVVRVPNFDANLNLKYVLTTDFGPSEGAQFSGNEELFFNFSYTSI